MTTLPPPAVEPAPENSLEKKVYNIVENLSEFIPVMNDRNRLAFSLFKFLQGEGDKPEILVKSTKIKLTGITQKELAEKINSAISGLKE